MSDNPCVSSRENIPAYVLDALDSDEITALESHLRSCAACSTELATYRTVGDSLLMALPPQPPPVALRARLQGRLSAAPPRRNWLSAFPWTRFALGAALAALVALNLLSFLQLQSLQRQQAQMMHQAETQQAVLAILAYPNIKSYPIWSDGVSGRLLLDEHHSIGALILWNLPSLPEDETYQVWLIDSGGDRTSAGLFRPEVGQALTSEVFLTPKELSKFIGLGVTIEPAGGAPEATGKRIFKVDF